MEQSIEVRIIIPQDLILLKKIDYDSLIKENLEGRTWGMRELSDHLQIKRHQVIKERILLPNRDELDIVNGGFVVFADGQTKWAFNAKKMAQWIDDNYKRIYMNL